MNNKFHGIYGILLITAFIAVRFVLIPNITADTPQETAAADEEKPAPAHNPFDDLELDAAAAYVIDLTTTDVLLSHNAQAQLPLASLTKLMTALLAVETLDTEAVVVLQPESLLQDGDQGFVLGERIRSRDLIDATLVGSSNDGAHALASALRAVTGASLAPSAQDRTILDTMNTRAQELGLGQTYFANATGLDIHEAFVGGAYGSAADIGTLLAYVTREHPELLEPTRNGTISVTSLTGLTHEIENTNELVDTIPWLVGSKTGFTDLAGGNLGIVFDAGLARPVAAVVLGATKESRFSDIEKIVNTTFDYLALQ